jgi:hypothetical protein
MTQKPQPTIASLVREAAKSETSFLATLNEVLDDDEPERLEEFFAKLNIPRSVKGDDAPADDLARAAKATATVSTFEQELKITDGIQKFLDRHMRKLRWHVAHPTLDGTQNCIRLFRAMSTVTGLRLRRVIALLEARNRLSVEEWGQARELMNRAFREIREALFVVATSWVEALMDTNRPEEVRQALTEFPEMVHATVKTLKELRDAIEERRLKVEVKPEGYAAVKPPRYFGGDLLDVRSWRHFWGELSSIDDNLKATLRA